MNEVVGIGFLGYTYIYAYLPTYIHIYIHIIYFMYMSVSSCIYIYICTTSVPSDHGGEKKIPEPLELVLMVLSPHVGARN